MTQPFRNVQKLICAESRLLVWDSHCATARFFANLRERVAALRRHAGLNLRLEIENEPGCSLF
jgi:hypothetical protein